MAIGVAPPPAGTLLNIAERGPRRVRREAPISKEKNTSDQITDRVVKEK